MKETQTVLTTRVSRLVETIIKPFCNHLISKYVKLVYNFYSSAFSEWLKPYVLYTFAILKLDISLYFQFIYFYVVYINAF
jgi:hypothetical protein